MSNISTLISSPPLLMFLANRNRRTSAVLEHRPALRSTSNVYVDAIGIELRVWIGRYRTQIDGLVFSVTSARSLLEEEVDDHQT